jgi:hypothetical protein
VKLATLFFDTTEGVLAGDLMKLYEKNTGTFENITVVMVDNNQNAL